MASLATIDSTLPGLEPGPAAPFPLPLKVFISYKQNDFLQPTASGSGSKGSVGIASGSSCPATTTWSGRRRSGAASS